MPTIRQATSDDAGAIAAIHVESWKTTYRGMVDDAFLDALSPDHRLGMWQRMLDPDQTDVAILVAEREGEVVGFASYGPRSDEAEPEQSLELHTLYLRPALRRQGIGSQLIRAAEQEMAKNGATTAFLWVHRDNSAAQRFYEAHRWQRSGQERTVMLWGVEIAEVRYIKGLSAKLGNC